MFFSNTSGVHISFISLTLYAHSMYHISYGIIRVCLTDRADVFFRLMIWGIIIPLLVWQVYLQTTRHFSLYLATQSAFDPSHGLILSRLCAFKSPNEITSFEVISVICSGQWQIVFVHLAITAQIAFTDDVYFLILSTAEQWYRTHISPRTHYQSLPIAGLQVHATTPSWCQCELWDYLLF